MGPSIDERLIVFARWVIEQHRDELGDLEAGTIQDKLEGLGLLVRVEVTGPCGEECRCAEYYDQWPAECLRLAEGVMS